MATFNKPEFNSVWATSGAKVAPDAAKISLGWVVEIPPHEIDNWIRNRQDAMLAHINQAGVVYWDETVEYQANKSYVQGRTTGNVYRAITTHTGVNPETDVNNNWQIAFEAGGSALLKAENLADVPDKALARQNLGISTTSDYDARYLQRSQNLADVPNKASGRANLGLGNSATRDVGTGANTVAAGNDSRIVNAVQTSRQVVAGNGLVGGGNLSENRQISMGTPSTVTATSNNSVSTGTHTHAIDLASLFPTAYYDMLNSRTYSQSYQNTSNKMWFIGITGRRTGSGSGRLVEVSPNGSSWMAVGRLGAGDDSEGAFFMVPSGYFYRVDGQTLIESWVECR